VALQGISFYVEGPGSLILLELLCLSDALQYFETSGNTRPTTQHHIRNKCTRQLYQSENAKSQFFFVFTGQLFWNLCD
jgi:hypothetical protein